MVTSGVYQSRTIYYMQMVIFSVTIPKLFHLIDETGKSQVCSLYSHVLSLNGKPFRKITVRRDKPLYNSCQMIRWYV